MRERVALVDRDGVRDAVARVHDDAGGTARRVEREDGLDGDVHGRDVEGLEHDLRHLLAVGLRVERGLGEEDRVLLRGDTELVVEGVVPDLRRRTGSGAQHRRGEHKDQTTRQGHQRGRARVPRGESHAEATATRIRVHGSRWRQRTFSMSSQLVTMPCSIGYLSVRMPRFDWASSPTYESFWPMPTMTPGWRGRPMIDGKTARGASSPAKPACEGWVGGGRGVSGEGGREVNGRPNFGR